MFTIYIISEIYARAAPLLCQEAGREAIVEPPPETAAAYDARRT